MIKDHYKNTGIKQGRHRYCAERITKTQAHCYLDKYPDLKKAFGYNVHSWIKAEQHYYNTGKKEGRDPTCEVGQGFKCANEGSTCACGVGNQIFYGMKMNYEESPH